MSLLDLDKDLFFLINTGMSNPLLDFLCPLMRSKYFWIWLYLIVLFLLFKKYRYKTIYLFVLIAVIIIISDQTSASLIKPYFKRLRPCNDVLIQDSVRLLLEHCGRGFSFVSSHATNHFAFAVFCISFLKHKFKWVFWLGWAAVISFSQVYVGVHFPLDVIIGAFIGIIISTVAIKIFTIKFPNIMEKPLL